ncbi:hypothetical protein LTS10_005456 [Elasticomyces elasticus]|nr:hypothetical protein LTS10_005456 [Elasticomyces elasticus]
MPFQRFDDAELDKLTPEHKNAVLKRRADKLAEKKLREEGDTEALARADREREKWRLKAKRRTSQEETLSTPTTRDEVSQSGKRKRVSEVAAVPKTAPTTSKEASTSPPRRRLRKRSSLTPATLSRLREPSQAAVNGESTHGRNNHVLPTPSVTAQPESPEPRAATQPARQAAVVPSAARLVKKGLTSRGISVIELSDDEKDAKPPVKAEAPNAGSPAARLNAEPLRPTQASTTDATIRNHLVSSPAPATEQPVVDRAASVKCEIMKLRMNLVAAERQEAEKVREQAALQLEYYQMQMQ